MRIYKILFIFFLFSCHQKEIVRSNQSEQDSSPWEHIVILYTNDEHGWMEPTADHAGAAALLNTWVNMEGCGPCLILSGGDMWTGPAISTLTDGESMVHVMNAMGYDAAALGNHEFDFGIDNLKERISEMNFPILAANLKNKKDGKRPEFVLPYTITDVNNVSVGIIGLALIQTPRMTKAENVTAYDFTDYAQALKEVVPQVKSDGAELLIVIAHICHEDMTELAPLAAELGISVIGGGHCHELYEDQAAGVTLIQSGSNLENYVKVEILFDDDADSVVNITTSLHPNNGEVEDTVITEIISGWRAELDQALSEVIGYAEHVIPEKSAEMVNMITDSWLYGYPHAQIVLTNRGGIRQSIPAGDITIETIHGILPFKNNILELNLSGKEVLDCLNRSVVIAGMTSVGGYQLTDGRILHPDSSYVVLINDFMYTLPNTNFSIYDEDPYDTGTSYRQPLIEWLKSLDTSIENPVNNYLDYTPR